MRKSAEERREEVKAYYWRNRDIILEKARKEADECKRRRAEQKEKKTTSLQFYTEWQKQLSERLKDDDLDDWLRTAIKLLSEQINSIIHTLNYGE